MRGICIVFVVFFHSMETTPSCHVGIQNYIRIYISSFFLPIFFFASGFIFNKERYPRWPDFILHKVRTRIVPYVLLFCISYLIFVTKFLFTVENRVAVLAVAITLPDSLTLFGLLWGNADVLMRAVGNPPLWFLPCLFVTEILFYMISKLSDAKLFIPLSSFAVLAYFLSSIPSLNEYRYWFNANIAVTAVIFYGFGYMANRFNWSSRVPHNRMKLLVLWLLLNIASIPLALSNGEIGMANNNIVGHNYLFFLLSAFSGIIVYSLLSMELTPCKTIKFLGENSLIIFVFNWQMQFQLKGLLNSYAKAFQDIIISHDIIYFSLLLTLMVIVLTVPIIFLINYVFPVLIGRSYRNKIAQSQA